MSLCVAHVCAHGNVRAKRVRRNVRVCGPRVEFDSGNDRGWESGVPDRQARNVEAEDQLTARIVRPSVGRTPPSHAHRLSYLSAARDGSCVFRRGKKVKRGRATLYSLTLSPLFSFSLPLTLLFFSFSLFHYLSLSLPILSLSPYPLFLSPYPLPLPFRPSVCVRFGRKIGEKSRV